MKLPQSVNHCLQMLEQAGFSTYAVGGCVRDWLLGLQPHDYDLCTAATPEQMRHLFREYPLVLAGEKHGTVGVVTEDGVVEITTFRTEGEYRDNRHPDQVSFVTDIREDLARRDFTVNAMAYSPSRGLQDPFGGAEDLKNHILRAVGDPEKRFREDSLRILRGVRFSVRFHLTPTEETLRAMTELASLMDNLARERVFEELCKMLPLLTAEEMIRYAPVLTRAIPPLREAVGFCQHSRHHAYDVYTHTAYVVENTPAELELRWAALLHDVGKPATFSLDQQGNGHFYNHAKVGAEMAEAILRQLKAPNALRQRVVFLVEQHMTPLPPEPKLLRRRLSRYGQEAIYQLLALQKADFSAKGVKGTLPEFALVEKYLGEILAQNGCLTIQSLAVDGHDLMALGFQGKAIGAMLQELLEQVLEERLPNEGETLLEYAKNRR